MLNIMWIGGGINTFMVKEGRHYARADTLAQALRILRSYQRSTAGIYY